MANMKPICAKCQLFFRMKQAGFYFEEGMPGPSGAKRTELEHDEYGVTRVAPGPLDGWQSYKLWVGDLWECRGCGAQLIIGFAGPLAEHYQDHYQDARERFNPQFRLDDC